MNKDLYERYLQKKAKKLGISVEELKAANGNTSAISTSTEATPTIEEKVVESVQETLPTQTYSNCTTSYTNPTPTTYTNTVSSFANTAYSAPVYTPTVNEELTYTTPSTPTYQTNNYTYTTPSQPVIKDQRENKFALIGYPLGHSLSAIIHSAGFKSINTDAKYDILETNPEDLVERIKMLKNSNYKGFNVTIPLKLPVALFVDEVDKYADIASAINTVVINPDRTLKGYNTDVIGFKNAIPKDFNLTGKVAGILGTGGASRAATVALADSGVKEIRFYTRNIPNSIELLNYMRRVFPQVQFDAYQIENIRDLSMVDILVNTTPIGMQGYCADLTPVERYQLSTLPQNALVYDVIYNPKKTVLLKLAEELGYRTVNGIDMFLNQAFAAEQIWLDQTPNIDSMRIALLEAM